MNFQAVNQGNGGLVVMNGTIAELGVQKLNKKGNPYMSVKIADTTGEKHSVTIQAGKTGLPNASMLGKLCVFALSTYQGQNGIAYSGFCNGLAVQNPVNPTQQQYQQTMQQRLKPQTQQPVPQTDKAIVDWEAKDMRMARMCALNNATLFVTTFAELLGKPEECTPAAIKAVFSTFVDLIYGNPAKKPADMTTAELLATPAEVDDLPFGNEDGTYEERN